MQLQWSSWASVIALSLECGSDLPLGWQVIDGMLTVRKIENVAVGANSKPKLPIVISQSGVRARSMTALLALGIATRSLLPRSPSDPTSCLEA